MAIGKVSRVADRQFHCHLYGILVGTHIGECPSLATQTLHKFLDGLAVVLVRGILHAVGDDSDDYHTVLNLLDMLAHSCERNAHGVI